jgi:hypothetical protein
MDPEPSEPVFFDYEAHQWACLHCWTPNVGQMILRGQPVPCCGKNHPSIFGVCCTSDPGHGGEHRACGPGHEHHPVLVWSGA